MSELPLHELYTIEGEEGPAKERVKKAMDWLLSPAAEGIGEKLLRDAYVQADKPVVIHVTHSLQSHYENSNGEHTVFINPSMVVQFIDKKGTTQQLSLEQLLGHELTHAGQDIAADPAKMREVTAKFLTAKQDAYKNYWDHLSAPELKEFSTHRTHLKNTPYYAVARHHMNPVIEVGVDANLRTEQRLFSHPDYQEYMQKYEKPALATERQIGTLQGKVGRVNYKDGSISIEQRYEIEKEILEYQYGVKNKLGIPPLAHPATKNPDFWQKAVKNPEKLKLSKWEPNAHEHPLIAQHTNGDIPS